MRRIGTIDGASWKGAGSSTERFDTTDRNAAIFMAPAVATHTNGTIHYVCRKR